MNRERAGLRLTMPVSVRRDHIRGRADARITLVEYGDFESRYCGAAHRILTKVLEDLGDDVRLVFRNFPLTRVHPHARAAAEAAEAAAAQGRFWEMHDWLFDHQESLGEADLLDCARDLDLDLVRFIRELLGGSHMPRIREDCLGGIRSGVTGTPTFFVNGRRHEGGYDPESLIRAIIEAARDGEEAPGDDDEEEGDGAGRHAPVRRRMPRSRRARLLNPVDWMGTAAQRRAAPRRIHTVGEER